MISFEPTEKQLAMQEHFRRLAVERLQTRSMQIDAAIPAGVDADYLAVIAEENLNAFLIPEAYGGRPLDRMSLAILFEELGAGCAGFAAVYAQTFHGIAALLIGGSEEQKKRFFPLLLPPGGHVASFCVTEEKSGSNTSSFSTFFNRKGRFFILRGEKNPVINAGQGRFYVVWANEEGTKNRSGISTFLIPEKTEGLRFGPYHDKPGFRPAPTATVHLENVCIPIDNMIGPAGSGYLLLMQTLDWGRALSAAIAVGLARAAIEEVIRFAKQRVILKRPIIRNQSIAFLLADLVTELEAARALVWRACRLIDIGKDHTVASSMAKLYASELAVRATTEGLLILGQSGYRRPSLMEKLHRDAQAFRIAEGTSHVQKLIISGQL
ncbi:MAG: acyl-CoA dehydrogenase family protein [Smithella sp.]|jgi:alkylation response protein AidB-like acyl-CoA dehydrogenase